MRSFRQLVVCNISRRIRLISTSRNQHTDSQSKVVVEQTSSFNHETDNITNIVIPKRKHRDSTSILKALSSTVERDPNAAEYQFVDDPFLIPTTFMFKKDAALSKASGRRAARYFVDRFPAFFNPDLSNPTIEAFKAQKLNYEITEANEDGLRERIEMRRTTDAIQVYKQIKMEEGEISLDTQLDLLDLLCYYNCQDPPPQSYPVEDFYPEKPKNRKLNKTWRDDSEAEKLFEELPEKTARAYNTLCTGMARNIASEKAMELYQEMLEKQIPVDVETFSVLIRYGSLCEQSHSERWKLIREMLLEVKNQGVQPTTKLFEYVLNALSFMSYYYPTPELAMRVLSEMKKCDIEPSLGCFKCIVELFYQNDECQSDVLMKIINYLWGKKIVYQDSEDLDFFFVAMLKCCTVLKDVDTASKIETLASRNGPFTTDAIRMSVFYSYYFRLLCMYDTIERVMEVYSRLVPNLWGPSHLDLAELLKTVELYDGYKYLPQIWSDIALLDLARLEEILKTTVSLMAKKSHPKQLQDSFCDAAEFIFKKWNTEQKNEDTIKQFRLTAEFMGYMIQIHVNGNRSQLAWELFQTLKNKPKLFFGSPGYQSLASLIQSCINDSDTDSAMEVVMYMTEHNIQNTHQSVSLIQEKLELTDTQRDQLSRLR